MLGNKDLDYFLTEFCDDDDIINLSRATSSCFKRYGDEYFSHRFFKKCGFLPENYSKKDYYVDTVCLKNWELAIKKDKSYLLPFLFSDSDYGLKYKMAVSATIHDSILCFKELFGNHVTFLNTLAIEHNSSKILKYLKEIKQLNFNEKEINIALKFSCMSYIELIPIGTITNLRPEMFCYDWCYNDKEWILFWITHYNPALDLFLKKMDEKMLKEIQTMSLDRNCYHVIKMIIRYTSNFNFFE